MGEDRFCVDFVSPRVDKSIYFYDLAIGLPTAAFLVFLAWGFRHSAKKLRRSGSNIMTTYYCFLWGVSLLNLIRCCTQIAQTEEGGRHVLWNLLWLLTRFGMVLLEVSVVVFLLQGYSASGLEALIRTLAISSAIALFESIIMLIYIFGVNVPLFMFSKDADADMSWAKWSFWLLHHLAFLLVYLLILVVPYTQWRDLLPAKPSFYRYVAALFLLSLTAVLGSIFIGSHVTAGYCVYGVASFLYYAAYPPLLYWTFLAEFFADDELDLELRYYSEMREAGYFEDNSLGV